MLQNQDKRSFEFVNIENNQMYSLNINLMDMSINLNVHFLQNKLYLGLQCMFAGKIEILN